VAGALTLPSFDNSADADWTLAETESVAHVLYEDHATFEQLLTHLHTAPLVVMGISAFEPADPDPTISVPHRSLIKVARTRLPKTIPPSWQLVDLPNDFVAVLAEQEPWVNRLAEMTVCTRAINTDAAPVCYPYNLGHWPSPGTDGVRFIDRRLLYHPHVGSPYRLPTGAFELTYRLPISIVGADPSHHLELLDDQIWPCGFQFIAVDAVSHRGELPAKTVWLDNGAEKQGTIVITRQFLSRCPLSEPKFYPPPLVETAAHETALAKLLNDHFSSASP